MTSPEEIITEGACSTNPRTRQQAALCRSALDQLDAMLADDALRAEMAADDWLRDG